MCSAEDAKAYNEMSEAYEEMKAQLTKDVCKAAQTGSPRELQTVMEACSL